MTLLIGALIVMLCTFGGYAALGGKLSVLWQPFEAVIIVGAATGGYVIANPGKVLRRTGLAIKAVFRGPRQGKESYVELLGVLYQVLKLTKTKGMLTLEQHIEHPEESSLFAQFPHFKSNPVAVTFLCDHLRLMSLGADKPMEMEDLMDEEIQVHHHEHEQVASALRTVADSMPALGIVAAVLGVIKTMGSITEPPEVLGHLIGGALVGTFLGVWLSYGFVGPIANKAKAVFEAETKYLNCIKAALLAHMHGCAPAVSVEFARKALLSDQRPSFYELEEAVEELPPVA